MSMPPMIDMARSPEEAKDAMPMAAAIGDTPKYPWGLSISLTQDELEKLDVDHSDWEVGNVFHLHAFAKVTSISENETENGKCCRVELQITHLAGIESEDEENEEYERPKLSGLHKKMYASED